MLFKVISVNCLVSLNCYILVVSSLECNGVSEEQVLRRSQRNILLFPNSTILQINIGVGTPTPLKEINVNWAFQANFQLPWNRTQVPDDILLANSGYIGDSRRTRDTESGYHNGVERYDSNSKLYHFYKYLEDIINGIGYNGTSCVLRALCQLGAEPLYSTDDEDLLHEIASFLLDPTNDIISSPTDDREAKPYINAYQIGQNTKNCTTYSSCPFSLVDSFTNLYDEPSEP